MAEIESSEGKSVPQGSEKQDATVSRAAWLFGWAFGIAIAVGSFYAIQAMSLPKWASVPLEVLAMAAALVLTTSIWRRSTKSSYPVEYEGTEAETPVQPSVQPAVQRDEHKRI